MRMNECVQCELFPCDDVRHDLYVIPDVELKPDDVSIVMISEAAPADPDDYYYILVGAKEDKLYVNGKRLKSATPETLKSALVWAGKNPGRQSSNDK